MPAAHRPNARATSVLTPPPPLHSVPAPTPQGDHKAGEIQGQTRQHARLINLLGVRQLIIGVNKMDSDTAGYKQERYNEIRDEMKHMLARVGWKVRARSRRCRGARWGCSRRIATAPAAQQRPRPPPLSTPS
jgi:hypothetical protein